MIIPKLKSLTTTDLSANVLPDDPQRCSIHVEAVIGNNDSEGGDVFSFLVVTPLYLVEHHYDGWGRGLLLMNTFSWAEVESRVLRLLAHAARPSWSEVAAVLSKELHWEFEGYRSL